jgi:hypothetical protein
MQQRPVLLQGVVGQAAQTRVPAPQPAEVPVSQRLAQPAWREPAPAPASQSLAQLA